MNARRAEMRKAMHAALVVLGALFGVALAGCGGGQPASQAQQERRYELRGTVISIDRAHQQIVVDHEEIKDFMGAMAMPYPVADAAQLDIAGPGDEITADVVVKDSSAHLENIVVVKKAEPKPGGSLRAPAPIEFAQQDSTRVPFRQRHPAAALWMS